MSVDPGLILIVEDNATDAELMQHTLRPLLPGKTIRVLTNGAEALQYLEGQGLYSGRLLPCLVLLDLKLPKVAGIEVLKRIRSQGATRSIPVVIVTSSAEEKDVQATYASGANSYLQKPIDFQQFRQVLVRLARYWFQHNVSPAQLFGC
jgi:two-component system, response regulator